MRGPFSDSKAMVDILQGSILSKLVHTSIAHLSDSIDGRTDSFACHRPFNGPVGSRSKKKSVSNDRFLEVALAVDPELV